ncbi:MAG: UDP-N-acetylmuramoyl-L-alanine--D-glutamate ligase [Planctomycetota bacterium]
MGVTRDFRDRRVLVMGLGRFGGQIGAVRFFAGRGAVVTVTDRKSAAVLAASVAAVAPLGVKFRLGEHRAEDFRAAEIVCVSPAIRMDDPLVAAARAAGAVIVTEIGLFFAHFPGTIIGVTGSNGKSTTTRLVHDMLAPRGRVHLGGNIGGSLLPAIDAFTAADIAVLELSSFQLKRLEEGGRSPATAVLTNITPNHLDWHTDLEDYRRAKAVIAQFQGPGDHLVYDAADPGAAAVAAAAPGRKVAVNGAAVPCVNFDGDRAVFDDGRARQVLFTAGDLQLPGGFNRTNAMLAAAAAHLHGAAPAQIATALRAFHGLPHRLETVGTVAGVRFVNDSIATTPESVVAAAGALGPDAVFLLGGSDKGVSLAPAVAAVAAHAAGAVCLGAMGPALAAALRARAPGFPVVEADGFEAAVRQAFRMAAGRGRGTVALSPACASFDMFVNFEERGETFRAIVKELATEATIGSGVTGHMSQVTGLDQDP